MNIQLGDIVSQVLPAKQKLTVTAGVTTELTKLWCRVEKALRYPQLRLQVLDPLSEKRNVALLISLFAA